MIISRRTALAGGSATLAAFAALGAIGQAGARSTNRVLPLLPDPNALLDLPRGFSYSLVSLAGGVMSDGFYRPGRPDGMACFAHPTDRSALILIRNHENWPTTTDGSPFGEGNRLRSRLRRDAVYDESFFGGTTTLVIDRRTGALRRDYLSLIGTTGNCAGGPTPWGSWLSCEESAVQAGKDNATVDHGYVFEVPITASRPVTPAPLKAMGRFAHEAAAVDPVTGDVYMTEDQPRGLFYRFVPNHAGRLAQGGKLQALAIRDWPAADTRNWPLDWSEKDARTVPVGANLRATWVDLDQVESPEGDLAARGAAAGCAIFCRGEGLAYARDPEGRSCVYFVCTQGGRAQVGQVWRYRTSASRRGDGDLTLVFESPGADTLDLCDNMTVTPWGDLLLCEDGRGDNYLRILGKDGSMRDFARNAHADKSEFCGACFSPDGKILFVNVQESGQTYAIRGPWESLA